MSVDKSSDGYVETTLSEAGVATITFFHPSHNALPGHLLADLTRSILDTDTRTDVKVIVLKSGGNRTFCAGASFDELIAVESEAQGFQFFSGFAEVINACRTCKKVILGRVQGKAIGGGVGVAASSDYCFALKYASVRLSEIAIGIGPFVVGPAIERKIGLPAFSYLALNPTKFESATWAHEKGLYHEVFDDVEAMDAAIAAKAVELAGYNPDALTALKRNLWEGTEDWDVLLAKRARISGQLVLSKFTRDAIKAFKSR